MVAMATAAAPNRNENNEFSQLNTEQRTCIAKAIEANTSIIASLKNCHTTNGGLACVKAIPALSSCFV
jgi:hypothetical protein